MTKEDLINVLERSPIIAAVNDGGWDEAMDSPVEVIFYLKPNLITIKDKIAQALAHHKIIFVHLDLSDGIGKDRTGIDFLKKSGVNGIISTRNQLITYAKDNGLLTVQRFFALDSQGLHNIRDIGDGADFIEIMPGVIQKVIKRYASNGANLIAGGLIETKDEVLAALGAGAIAVSTGKQALWNM